MASTDVSRTQQRRSMDTARTFRGQGVGDLRLAARQFTGFCNEILWNSSDFSKLLVTCTVCTRVNSNGMKIHAGPASVQVRSNNMQLQLPPPLTKSDPEIHAMCLQ